MLSTHPRTFRRTQVNRRGPFVSIRSSVAFARFDSTLRENIGGETTIVYVFEINRNI